MDLPELDRRQGEHVGPLSEAESREAEPQPIVHNLTPHPIRIFDANNQLLISYEPSGVVARAEQYETIVGDVEVLPGTRVNIVTMSYGKPMDLPEPKDGTYHIVSLVTAKAAQQAGRDVADLLIPTKPVRNEEGTQIGSYQFSILAEETS